MVCGVGNTEINTLTKQQRSCSLAEWGGESNCKQSQSAVSTAVYRWCFGGKEEKHLGLEQGSLAGFCRRVEMRMTARSSV